jgi:hypothetical protein
MLVDEKSSQFRQDRHSAPETSGDVSSPSATSITEPKSLEFRAEMFNRLNPAGPFSLLVNAVEVTFFDVKLKGFNRRSVQ